MEFFLRVKSHPHFIKVQKLLRFLWILTVSAYVLYWLSRDYPIILKGLRTFDVWYILGSVMLLYGAKFCVALTLKQSFNFQNQTCILRDAIRIYVMTDITKYLPGGVWGIVSRLGSYQLNDFTRKSGKRAFALENFWLIFTSFALGIAFYSVDRPLWGISLVGVWALVIFVGSSLILRTKLELRKCLACLGLQLGIFVALGLSLSLLLKTDASLQDHVKIWGAFGLARALGYLAFFAPAGIGVRELTLLALLSNHFGNESTLLSSALSRILTMLAEFVLFIFVLYLSKSKQRSHQ